MADTVLIVDDDQAVSTMLYKVIRSNGIDAETASSGERIRNLGRILGHDPKAGYFGIRVICHGSGLFPAAGGIERKQSGQTDRSPFIYTFHATLNLLCPGT